MYYRCVFDCTVLGAKLCRSRSNSAAHTRQARLLCGNHMAFCVGGVWVLYHSISAITAALSPGKRFTGRRMSTQVPKWIQSYCNAHTREELIVTYGHWISAARGVVGTGDGRAQCEHGRHAPRGASPSWAGVPTNGWDGVFPETKR